MNRTLFHGTHVVLPVGTILFPGGPDHRCHWDVPEDRTNAVYVTTDYDGALGYARHATHQAGGVACVYEVAPLADLIQDFTDGEYVWDYRVASASILRLATTRPGAPIT